MTEETDRNDLIRQLAGALANVAILTALLVYFGWVRAEVQSRRLGFDESLLGATTRDYLLRSVRPVLVLLIAVAVGGLLWVALDRWLTRRLRDHGPADPVGRWAVRALLAGPLLLPAPVVLAGYPWPGPASVAFPLAVAGGILLLVYGLHVRATLPGGEPLPAGRDRLVRACTAVLVLIGLFTAAANYATIQGIRLADGFVHELAARPAVVVYSGQQLHIDAPGVREEELAGGDQSAYRYRYLGLRLLEHMGGQVFLVSDGWTPRYGVVVALARDAPVRLEFVRDRRGGR